MQRICALTLLLFLRCFRSCCPTGCLYITLHPHFACRPPHRRSRDAQPKDAEQCTETAATNSDPGARTDGSDWTLPGRCAARSSPSAHHCDHHQPPVSKKRAPHTHTHTQRCHFQSRVTTRCCFVLCARTCVETALLADGDALVVCHRSVHSVDRAHGHRSPRCHHRVHAPPSITVYSHAHTLSLSSGPLFRPRPCP
jgi:hypothetical protein